MNFKDFLKEQEELALILEDATTFSDLHDLVKQHIDAHIKEIAAKVKAWALEALHNAKKLGKNEEVFAKVVNNPMAATVQLVARILQNTELATK